jgi:hypothetical protein
LLGAYNGRNDGDMTTPTITQPSIVCPDWCTDAEHDDMDRPGGSDGRSPIAQQYDADFARGEQPGCFAHLSATSDIGGVHVDLGLATTRDGRDLDDGPLVNIAGHCLTLGQARLLADTIGMYVDAALGHNAVTAVQA